MEQLADVVPIVQILDILGPQMVEQLADIMRFFDTLMPVPEQVIDVPKILPDGVPARTAVRDTQLVEQLVEVPTIVLFFFVAADCGAERRHSSSWSWRAIRWSSRCFTPDRIQQRLRRRSLTFPFVVEVFKVFAQGKVHLLLTFHSHFPAGVLEGLNEPGVVFFFCFFSHFSPIKKLRRPQPPRV